VVILHGQLAPAALGESQMVVHVELSQDGRPVDCWTKNVSFKQSFTYALPVALNAAPGAYRVKVTEAITGQTQEVNFTVK
jgi:hypothetical protein